ncbi:protein-disulfide reductase DsbD family protein [Oceanospirillaceae bacterium]|nr:protein-disulfide reductase DsbD family protein [Oceanospirillaceae bacterium]
MRAVVNCQSILYLAALLAGLLWSNLSWSQAGQWQHNGPVSARLISDQIADAGNDTQLIRGGLQLKLQPGWKTYWKVPGAAGAAPVLNIAGEEDKVEFQWPAPTRFEVSGLQGYGYEGEVVLPFTWLHTREFGDGPMDKVDAVVKVYVCNLICLPVSLNIELPLVPINNSNFVDFGPSRLLGAYRSKVPRNIGDKFYPMQAGINEDGISLSYRSQAPAVTVDAFIENINVHEWAAPEVVRRGDEIVINWQAPESWVIPSSAEPLLLELTLVEGDKSYALSQNMVYTLTEGYPWVELLTALLMAFFGGLILNFMPCVLPILSIKFLTFTKPELATDDSQKSLLLYTTAGIVAFFMLLALAVIGLRFVGVYIGWGTQFQSPVYLALVLFLVLTFSANMLGWFEFSLPSNWYKHFGAQQAPNAPHSHSPRFTAFLQGAFTTILATPCSAPFVGVAVAFALTADHWALVLIFFAMSIGLSAPYLLVYIQPKLLIFIPKPGPWMTWIKKLFSGLLFLTAGWLLWLISNHLGTIPIVAMTLMSMLWLLMWAPLFGSRGRARSVRRYLAPLIMLGSVLLIIFYPRLESVPNEPTNKVEFSLEQLNLHRAAGHQVFLNITADWCLTCKFNEINVLSNAKVMAAFESTRTVYMQGDWTLPSKEIEDFLTTQGRAGIPFYGVFYASKNAKKSTILPELLTQGMVLKAL